MLCICSTYSGLTHVLQSAKSLNAFDIVCSLLIEKPCLSGILWCYCEKVGYTLNSQQEKSLVYLDLFNLKNL